MAAETKIHNIKDKKDKLIYAGQEHILKYYDKLSLKQREDLLSQILSIDMSLVNELIAMGMTAKEPHPHLEPPCIIPIQDKRYQQAKGKGEEALKDGRIACFVVAGGQSTRLGYNLPKGTFEVGPVSSKSLFQYHAEKIAAMNNRYNTNIPWYIMTSKENDTQTRDFFQRHDFFQLQTKDVIFFEQGMLPAIDFDGKLIMDSPDHIAMSPNGHGGSLLGLKESGALDDMRRRGIKEIFYFQVDNALVKIADPVFIGYHLLEKAEMSTKVVSKIRPDEMVGVVGYINGRLGVIEYTELNDEERYAVNADGSLRFKAGNTAIHMLNVEFVHRLVRDGFHLPYHGARKKIPSLDKHGKLQKPHEPNGIKFETFIFDALRYAKHSVVMEVNRKEEFSPLKNISGQDSPETVRHDLINLYTGWCKAVGLEISDCPIEISPLFAMDSDEFVQRIIDKELWTQPEGLYIGSTG
ncbi:MAG: UDPGP type 1 family protein [bacterium]|nr:UDPGP type 1 family protein [bacterium]